MATFQLNQELGQEGQVIVVDESIAEQLKNGTIVLTEKNGQMVLQHQGYYNSGWLRNDLLACWSYIRYPKRIS